MNELDENQMRAICVALGWQGGTYWQALEEIKQLRKERDELRARLEMASADAARREQLHGDLEADLNDECDTLRIIKDKLQNQLAELWLQEPVATAWMNGAAMVSAFSHPPRSNFDPDGYWTSKGYSELPLYARPLPAAAPALVAQPVAWLAPAEVSEDWPWPHAFFAADAHPHIRELMDAFPVYASPVPAQAVPDGWRLVPKRLTKEMRSALVQAACARVQEYGVNSPEVMYEAAVSAAPEHKA